MEKHETLETAIFRLKALKGLVSDTIWLSIQDTIKLIEKAIEK